MTDTIRTSPQEIRTFWDDQARQFQADPRATTPDYWMREIEIDSISAVLQRMPQRARVLDIGSGNGYSTIQLMRRHPTLTFVGGDFSPEMVAAANTSRAELSAQEQQRITFEVRDVTDLRACAGQFDVVISDRCVINVPTREEQWRALGEIARALKAGGTYVALENFTDGQDNLNAERARHELPPVSIRWHNLFLDPEEFIQRANEWFEVRQTVPISSTYYLVTRVVYSKLCQIEGRQPDYDHPIYEIATKLPFTGNFGPIKLVELQRR